MATVIVSAIVDSTALSSKFPPREVVLVEAKLETVRPQEPVFLHAVLSGGNNSTTGKNHKHSDIEDRCDATWADAFRRVLRYLEFLFFLLFVVEAARRRAKPRVPSTFCSFSLLATGRASPRGSSAIGGRSSRSLRSSRWP